MAFTKKTIGYLFLQVIPNKWSTFDDLILHEKKHAKSDLPFQTVNAIFERFPRCVLHFCKVN